MKMKWREGKGTSSLKRPYPQRKNILSREAEKLEKNF
jgi:hypothetical protein